MRLIITLSIILIIAAVASLMVGAVQLPVADLWQALASPDASSTSLILHDIRLPRMWLAMMVGASLGLSGAAIQGYVRNPLAEPGVLGVSSGAALGAVCALYLGWSQLSPYLLPLCGMAGAFIAVLLVTALAGLSGGAYGLILAGIAISSFAGAAVAVVLNLSPNPFAVMEIVFWLMGSLDGRSAHEAWIALPFMLLGAALLIASARALQALSLGEETAASLGISLPRTQLFVMLGTALMVGAAVSVAGSIGFVGLVVPHLLRPFVRYSPSKLLIPSALGGAILLLLADIAVRIIPTSGTELKLGVITALIGGPFFILLLLRMRKGAA